MSILRVNSFLLWMLVGALSSVGWAARHFGPERLGEGTAEVVSLGAFGLAGVVGVLAVLGTIEAIRFRPTKP